MTFVRTRVCLLLEVNQQKLFSWKCAVTLPSLWMKEPCMVVLIMLDLSAAFDVIDHPMLLKRLEFSFGIKGKVLTSVMSYLTDRTRRVSVVDKTSPDVLLYFRVSQGSILRPKNYCMYILNQSAKISNDIILNIIVIRMTLRSTWP